MTNHFRTAMSKLTTEEASAVAAPLLAVLHASTDDGADAEAAIEFIDRYTAAMGVNGHELMWIAPNGRRFDEASGDEASGGDSAEPLAEELAEVSGFQHNGQPARPNGRRAEPWRGLAAQLTGGRLGQLGDDFILTVVGFTPTTVIVAAK